MTKTPSSLRQKRQRRDAWMKAAFAAGMSAAAIAKRQKKTRQWVYQRLATIGCPASALRPRGRRSKSPDQD